MTHTHPDLEPVVVSIDLGTSAERGYERFSAGFGEWWPTLTHSLSREPATRCALEAHAGGRVVEIAPDGSEHVWGQVVAVQHGRLIRFTWHPGREAESAQWVEVRFEPMGANCRATLIHGGWDALGEIAPILRREYIPGWQHVFGQLFAEYAGRGP